jgi:hypothetical protein
VAYWTATPPGNRKFLSANEFAATYGAEQTELDQVAGFARLHGLSVTEASASRRRVVVSGTAEQMSRRIRSRARPEYVTIPGFATARNILHYKTASLWDQPDPPNAPPMVTPIPGQEVDTFFGCWLDINQPDKVIPTSPPLNDWDNQMGSWASLPADNPLLSIQNAISKAAHQCLIAEINFDGAPISTNENTSNSDKLAQRTTTRRVLRHGRYRLRC